MGKSFITSQGDSGIYTITTKVQVEGVMVLIPLTPSDVMKVFSIFHKLISVLYNLYHNPIKSVMESHNTLV